MILAYNLSCHEHKVNLGCGRLETADCQRLAKALWNTVTSSFLEIALQDLVLHPLAINVGFLR